MTTASSHELQHHRREMSSAAAYRALAATVRVYMLEAAKHPAQPLDDDATADVLTLRRLLRVAKRFSPAGDLDAGRSSTEILDVVVDLRELVPTVVDVASTPAVFDMADWSQRADRLLGRVTKGGTLEVEQQEFLGKQFLPVLTAWMHLPPPTVDE